MTINYPFIPLHLCGIKVPIKSLLPSNHKNFIITIVVTYVCTKGVHATSEMSRISWTHTQVNRTGKSGKMLRTEAIQTQKTEHRVNGKLRTKTQSTRERQREHKTQKLNSKDKNTMYIGCA